MTVVIMVTADIKEWMSFENIQKLHSPTWVLLPYSDALFSMQRMHGCIQQHYAVWFSCMLHCYFRFGWLTPSFDEASNPSSFLFIPRPYSQAVEYKCMVVSFIMIIGEIHTKNIFHPSLPKRHNQLQAHFQFRLKVIITVQIWMIHKWSLQKHKTF